MFDVTVQRLTLAVGFVLPVPTYRYSEYQVLVERFAMRMSTVVGTTSNRQQQTDFSIF